MNIIAPTPNTVNPSATFTLSPSTGPSTSSGGASGQAEAEGLRAGQLAAFRQYQAGQALFAAGGTPPANATAELHRGWMSALNAAADADTYAYLSGVRN